MPEWLSQFDTTLFFFINKGMENKVLDLLMPFITSKAYIIVIPFLVLFFVKEKKKAFIIIALSFISVLFSDGLSNLLKHLIGRARPCNTLEGVHLLVGCTSSFSMPSNHASNAIAFAIPFFLSRNRLRHLFLSLSLLICFSRVYVGVHYPLDVLVGLVVGILSSLGVITIFKVASERFRERPYLTVMTVFLLFLSLFRIYYILLGPLDLSPDEAHYWEWSRRLDLSYYSKGPMIAYLIALGTGIFGDNVLGIRFPAPVFSALSSIYLYKLGRDMFNEKVGALSAILFQMIPLYSAFGVIFTIDSPFVFFWISSLYLLWKAIRHDSLSNWLSLGTSVGLGLLTKYTMAFFYLCALLFIVKERRSLLKRPEPYIALLLSLFIFSPVIIWNANHDWVTLRHTAGQAHIGEGIRLSLKSFFEFLGSQLGLVTPLLLSLIMIALWMARRGDNRERFLFWFSLPIITFFVLKSLHGKVQANWAMTGYITGLIALSNLFFEGNNRKISDLFQRLTIVAILVAFLLTVISHYPPGFLPVKLDPTSRLKGWRQLGREVSAIYEEMKRDPLSNADIFIFSDRYQVSSELAFYVKGNPVTYCANLGRRMNQYDIWPGFNNLIHYSAIFVTIGKTDIPLMVREGFQRCDKRVFEARVKGKLIREYSIFICYDFKGIKEQDIRSY